MTQNSNTMPTPQSNAADAETSRRELADGLVYIHNAIGSNIVKTQQATSHSYALAELLIRKGIISLHELDERRQAVDQQMVAETKERWMGARMMADETDKYSPEVEVQIDCAARLHLCKAACCRLGFYISKQDLEEGIVRWDLGRPYHIKQGENGYCAHCTTEHHCEIRQHRPLTCRAYDCRRDKRIWTDFDSMTPNPALAELAGRP